MPLIRYEDGLRIGLVLIKILELSELRSFGSWLIKIHSESSFSLAFIANLHPTPPNPTTRIGSFISNSMTLFCLQN